MKVLDHASEQNNSWIILGFAIAFAAALYFIARYWAAQHSQTNERLNKLQDERTQDLKDGSAKMLLVLADNSAAFKGFSEAIGSIKHLIIPEPMKVLTACVAVLLVLLGA